MKTRNIVQIRSHAQKYLIKICKLYDIKLSKKKFLNKKSSHLEWSEKDKFREKLDPQNMDIYDKNILNMFKYYDRNYPNQMDVISIQNKPPTDEVDNTQLNCSNLESLCPFSPRQNLEKNNFIDNSVLNSLLKLHNNNMNITKNFITNFVEFYSYSEKINLLQILKGSEPFDNFYNFKCNIINQCMNIMKDLENSFNLTKYFLENEKCKLVKQVEEFFVKQNQIVYKKLMNKTKLSLGNNL